MNTYFKIVILLVLSILDLTVLAQDVKFKHLSIEDGLSQNTVYAILQDSMGFLWFGTQDGLNKYDGYRFMVYRYKPQHADSLSHNEIFALFEDSRGVLWVGTGNGLNQYDRQQDKFSHYFHDPKNPNSLSHNHVWSIYEDNTGRLWIGTRGGLNQFDPQTGQFTHYQHEPQNPHSLSHNTVWPLYQDKTGMLWIGTYGGGLNKFERQSGKFTHYWPNAQNPDDLSNFITSIYEDKTGTLWIGSLNGLHQFDRQSESFSHYFSHPKNPNSLSYRAVWAITEDSMGNLWVGTDGGGLNQFDRQTGQFLHHQHKPLCPNSLNNDHIFSLYQDRAGTLWVGTNGGGLNQFNRAQEKFSHYFPVPNNPNTLNNKDVFAIYEDREGILWVGTENGGLNKFERQRQKVTHYLNDPENPNSLSHNEVQAIFEDSNGVLWIGTYGGGLNRFNRQQNNFVSYKNDPDNPNSLNDNYVMSIHEDKNKTLWIGTRKGLNQYDRQQDKFVVRYYHDPQNPYSLSHEEVSVIHEDYTGMLWIGTPGGGLNKIDLQTETGLPGSFVRYQHETQNPTSLSNDEILSIHEDATGTLWIGTSGGGLNQFDRETEIFTHYQEKDGLPNDTVYGILEDEQGYLWLSTNKGLSKFNPKTKTFRNYDVADGLQSNEFNINAYHKSRRGELFFGGINGFNAFYPLKVKDNPYIPPIVITEFKIFNQPVSFGGDSPLQQHISETHAITLSYKQSFFSFEFAALNFLQPEKNQYAYKLEGFDQSWNEIGTQRHTNYTYMPHGTYLFRVKGSNNDKVWNEKGTAITITIRPPPWKTWWAYTLYAFTILTIIGNYIRTQKQKLWAKQQELEREQKISAQLKEADKLKDEFLANTSHELRTPLNGIIGIAESLVDGAAGSINQQLRSNLAMIVGSGRRLFSLVNDILDFSQLKQKQINLQIKAVDIRTIADVVLVITQPLIGSKKLRLLNTIPSELPPINADENRVQQILYNLVGNAIKFTDRGLVKISAEILTIPKETESRETNLESVHNEFNRDKVSPLEKWLAITVSDTGIGVSPEKWDRIFEAFEQADGGTARIYGGTGLGLAVTQQLVQLHGGKMSVQSQPGVGSQFTFTLPLSSQSVTSYQLSEPPLISQAKYKVPLHPEPLLETKSPTTESKLQPTERRLQPTAENSGLQLTEETGKFTILVVDDDLINRQVLVNHLSLHNYTIHQAASGMEALASFEEKNKPELILLDVMMPQINGYEVTRKIRETWQADELPIILLTAKDQVADLVVGLESGANDYLTKPVYKDELLARIKTHVHILQLQAVRKKAERLQKEYNQNLTREVAERTQALRESEAQLRLAKNAADIANRAKSTFIANMSHELRTPLNAILGFTQVMQRSQSLSLEHQNWVKIIYNSGEYLLSLINDVLDMSKIEAGKITLDEQDFDLHSLLDEVHNLFYLKAKNKHIQCLVKRHDNVPHYIHTDSKKLRQILINLFSNAIKFTQTGGVYLYVEKISPKEETDADEKITLHFKVEDTGAGVAEEELNKLFEPFSQTMTGRASQEGTGLGLPISRQFIELMGGDISVQSQIGKGTVFQFTIRAPIVKTVKNVNTPAHQVIALEANQPHYRILIVDDKLDNRQLLIQLLNPLGFELREAGNGEQAINIFENWQPHLIWMDIRMPIMDGYQATQHIKAKKSEVVIIALTAGTFEKEPEKALSAGCDDFLRKPFREASIFDLMSKHLGVRYVYEKIDNLPETIKIDRDVFTPTALAALPSELLSELENAADSCDMEIINLTIDKNFMHNADLANVLKTLASDFKYEEISALIISRKGQPQGIAPTI